DLPLDQVIVAGDSGNDSDMIQACPRSVVVANCEEELRVLGRRHGSFMATRPHAAGVLEGLIAHGCEKLTESAA
ncbi:MAG: HAD family hydrolase, partial [Erythrobacter sp.]|nr:HAD family hydrolase [Erythrobacter sp.]